MNVTPISNTKYNRPSFNAKLKITKQFYERVEPYTNKYIKRSLGELENKASSFGKPNDIIELRFSMPNVVSRKVSSGEQGIKGALDIPQKTECLNATYQTDGYIAHEKNAYINLTDDIDWVDDYSEEALEVRTMSKILDELKKDYEETNAELKNLLKLEKKKRKRAELDKIKKQREE